MKGIPLAELIQPTLDALIKLGGSGRVGEIYKIVSAKYPSLELHRGGPRTEVEYRLGWARTYLKRTGYIEDSSHGVWTLTDSARQELKANRGKLPVDGKEIEKRARRKGAKIEDSPDPDEWKEGLLRVLVDEVTFDAFERLARRVLREAGFTDVEVTPPTGDKGIDGTAVLTINGLSAFRVAFQCKKYKESIRVTSKEIRDFRGAMVGRADRGIFITTATFTRGAVEEAARVGATLIDLMNGDKLLEKLKEYSLGVKTGDDRAVAVDHDWFRNL